MPVTETLQRTAFSTSRLLEFFTEKELNMQIGYRPELWGLALVKELIDNALDACESAGISPDIHITIEPDAVTVADNGPGLPYAVLEQSLDYAVRVSDKSHYVSPTRGQLGNALKCVWAAPFVVDGEHGCVEVSTPDYSRIIDVRLDRIAQRPVLELVESPRIVKTGTFIKMHWRGLASILAGSGFGFFYNAYTAFNPHASFSYQAPDEQVRSVRSLTEWAKWTPSAPTSPHWYSSERLKALIAAYVSAEQDSGHAKTVREFVAEFRGLSGSAKQQSVAANARLSGQCLHDLIANGDVRDDLVARFQRRPWASLAKRTSGLG